MYYVYAIKSKHRNYIYFGLTSNLKNRIRQHNNGHERTTRAYRPFSLIHFEVVDSRQKARVLEKKLKSSAGKEFLKSLE